MIGNLSLDDVVGLRDKALADFVGAFQDGTMYPYEIAGGGQDGAEQWNVAGVFCEVVHGSRFVLELVFVPGQRLCVARAYQEEPLTLLSLAVIGDLGGPKYDAVVGEFVKAASSHELKSIAAELEEMRKFVASEFGFDAGLALYPIPPPFGAWEESTDVD